MARVTIEDCMAIVGNHFRVAQIASRRARQLDLGKAPKIDRNEDKNSVVALRELAQRAIDESVLDESLEELMSINQPVPHRNITIANEDIGDMVADVEQYNDMNERDEPDERIIEPEEEQQIQQFAASQIAQLAQSPAAAEQEQPAQSPAAAEQEQPAQSPVASEPDQPAQPPAASEQEQPAQPPAASEQEQQTQPPAASEPEQQPPTSQDKE